MIAALLGGWRGLLHARTTRTWEEIVARLHPNPGGGEAYADSAAELDRCFTGDAIARRVESRQGRRAMFREAGVMMEMADYAERNGGAEMAPRIARLRAHAVTIRMATVKSLVGLWRGL